MIAAPKATSHGSKATTGGAFLAFTAMSAARAEPVVTIASAFANKATFFITSPIPNSYSVGSRKPPGANDPRKIALPRQFGLRDVGREAKITGICRLFGRFGDSTKGCRAVCLLDHIICLP